MLSPDCSGSEPNTAAESEFLTLVASIRRKCGVVAKLNPNVVSSDRLLFTLPDTLVEALEPPQATLCMPFAIGERGTYGCTAVPDAAEDDSWLAMLSGCLIGSVLWRADRLSNIAMALDDTTAVSLNPPDGKTSALEQVSAALAELFADVRRAESGSIEASWTVGASLPPELMDYFPELESPSFAVPMFVFESGLVVSVKIPEELEVCPRAAFFAGIFSAILVARHAANAAFALYSEKINAHVIVVPDEFRFPTIGTMIEPEACEEDDANAGEDRFE